MRELIDWLMYIERLSAKVYREAAVFFDDPNLTQILQSSAEDEAYHYQIMAAAHEIIKQHPEVESAFIIDKSIKAPIEQAFQDTLARLGAKSLSKEMMINCIVDTEYSEWNDIFLYVVNTLKRINPEFKSVAAKIQHHLRHIEYYLNSDDYGHRKVRAIRKLESIWTEKLLIIEDSPLISDLLVAVLKNEGMIDTAENGALAYEKIKQNYYRLIISDINMPVMDGITLFKEIVKKFPGIENRYLFFTGNPDKDTLTFLKSNNLKYLLKPASVHELKKQVMVSMHDLRFN